MNIFPMSGLASGPSIVTQWKGTSVKFLSDKILFFVTVRKSPIFFFLRKQTDSEDDEKSGTLLSVYPLSNITHMLTDLIQDYLGEPIPER